MALAHPPTRRIRRPVSLRSLGVLLVLTALLGAANVQAQIVPPTPTSTSAGRLPPPERRVILAADLQARHNPLGLLVPLSLIVREHHEADRSPLYGGTYWQYGLDVNVSPAFVEAGPRLEWKAMNPFIFAVAYHAIYFFGDFGYILDFPARTSPFGEDAVEPREDANEEQSGIAHRFMFQQTSQYKLGNLVIRNQITAYAHIFSGFEGQYFRERVYDTLQSEFDAMASNSFALLYQVWSGDVSDERILVGPYHEWVYALDARLHRHRLGAIFLAAPAERWGSLRSPRFYLQGGVNLQDPNRDDEFFVQGGFGGDFWLSARPVAP